MAVHSPHFGASLGKVTRTEPPRTRWLVLLLAPYFVGALGMAALVVDPSAAISNDAEPRSLALFRALFALAGVTCVLVIVGALRRWRGVARGATLLHVLIAALALAVLALGLKGDEPVHAGKIAEMSAKFGVHAALAWIWSRPAVRRAVSRSDQFAPTSTGAGRPTGASSGSADQTML